MGLTLKTAVRAYALSAIALMTTAGAANAQYDAKADEYFMSHCFEKATERYLKVFHSDKANKANPGLLRRITESVLRSEMVRDTARYFADLYLEFDPDDAEAYYMAAEAHYHAHDFGTALTRLDSFMVRTTTEEQIGRADILNSWIRNAKRFMRDTLPNPLINLGDQVNSPNNELNPYLINGGQTLIFSCDDKFDREAGLNIINIKASDQTPLSWSQAKKISGKVNSQYDEHPSGVTPDGFFFCSNNDGDFSLYQADYTAGGRGSRVTKMGKPINRKGAEVAACLSECGDTLFFSATNDNGKLNIYYTICSYNGGWMKPRPIPGLVNREESDENYPVLANDGTRLYFSSNREGTMGGYDLYYSDFDPNKNEWGTPVHLPYPINDTYDNMTISFTDDYRYAYLSLFREDSYGGRDIYAILLDKVVPASALFRYTLKVRNSKNKLLDIKSQPAIEIYSADGDLVALQRVNMNTHSFIVVLDPGSYKMTVDLEGTKHYEETIEVPERTYDAIPIERDIILDVK